ncbi:hypothetical protein B5P45_04090 [Phyllobacterium zundukense]|uniref:Uncharacterized protein n=1 Tax=Phyllobacterium zundukense TaxID=1867719 RepID=A0A2N9W2Z5_9HYPH|nr:hypothetical protein BLM14_20170 [Phyllobacterium zundukense]PIO46113.1 hypothetical protein B5P45_04090 [Phyllobacterium zundukense]
MKKPIAAISSGPVISCSHKSRVTVSIEANQRLLTGAALDERNAVLNPQVFRPTLGGIDWLGEGLRQFAVRLCKLRFGCRRHIT